MAVKLWLPLLMAFILPIMAACGLAAPQQPTPIAPPADASLPQIETAPSAEAIAETADQADPPAPVNDWLTVEGKTADNLFYLGNPNAPVTIIDYSDFL